MRQVLVVNAEKMSEKIYRFWIKHWCVNTVICPCVCRMWLIHTLGLHSCVNTVICPCVCRMWLIHTLGLHSYSMLQNSTPDM